MRKKRFLSLLGHCGLVSVVAVGVLSACGNGGRQGTLAGSSTLPTVSCTAGLGGATRVTGIGAGLDNMRFTWGFAPTYLPYQDVGLRDPNNPSATPSPSLELSSPPYSGTTSTQTLSVQVKFVFTDSSTVTRSFPCSKTGKDSPTLSIQCFNHGINPFEAGSYAEVVVRQTELSQLSGNGYTLETRWWWRYVPTWVGVLNPWTLVDVDTWATSVAFAGGKNFTYLTESEMRSSNETWQQRFNTNVDAPKPGDAAAALYGHVLVEVLYRGVPVSFRSEVDCSNAGL